MKQRKYIKKAMRFRGRNAFTKSLGRHAFVSYDFSDVEDNRNAFGIISKLASDAGRNAVAEAKVAGFNRIVIRDNQLIRVSADGQGAIIKSIPKDKAYYVKSTPHKVLHAIKR